MRGSVAVAAGAAAAASVLYGAKRLLEQHFDSDEAWLTLADEVRKSLRPPCQSSFRVVAVVVVGSRLRGEYVVGTNIEASNLGNSVCAERTAFGALQLYASRPVTAAGRAAALVSARGDEGLEVRGVFIVCDAERPITPGLLCREFMYSSRFCDPSTRVVTASPGLDFRIETTLGELLPHASPYTRLNAVEQKAWALGRDLELPNGAVDALARTAYDAARAAAVGDGRDGLHPVKYGAAVVFDDGAVATAHQYKALEYSCSLDPVGQLATAIDDNFKAGKKPAFIALVDALGVAHAPFAPGRAFLAEHDTYHDDLRVLCHDQGGALHTPQAAALAPSPPEFTAGDFLP